MPNKNQEDGCLQVRDTNGVTKCKGKRRAGGKREMINELLGKQKRRSITYPQLGQGCSSH
jgi:hypothetical protein